MAAQLSMTLSSDNLPEDITVTIEYPEAKFGLISLHYPNSKGYQDRLKATTAEHRTDPSYDANSNTYANPESRFQFIARTLFAEVEHVVKNKVNQDAMDVARQAQDAATKDLLSDFTMTVS